MQTLLFNQTITDQGGTNQYENRSDEAEEIKSREYEKYYFGTSIEEQIHGLRNVLRCHFIKESCARICHGGTPRKYYQFKKEWLQKEKDNFSKEVLICIR
jgi:hypothetical protein